MTPRKPKRPWNADLDLSIPGKGPEQSTGKVHVGHSTAGHMPALPEYHVVEVLADGSREVWMAGSHPWVGSERYAALEAQRLTRETGRQYEAVPVDSAQPPKAPRR